MKVLNSISLFTHLSSSEPTIRSTTRQSVLEYNNKISNPHSNPRKVGHNNEEAFQVRSKRHALFKL